MHARLAHFHSEFCWASLSSPALAHWPDKPSTLVLLPLHGCSDLGPGLPIDREERVTAQLLEGLVGIPTAKPSLLVLPPLRWLPARRRTGFFGVEIETVHASVLSLARGLVAAGFERLVFLNSSETAEPLVATLAIDLREALGLRTFSLHLKALGLDPSAPDEQVQAALPKACAFLCDLLHEGVRHPSKQAAPLPVFKAEPRPPRTEAPFPAYPERYLGAFTREALEGFKPTAEALALLPCGAIEQHGPHLPVGVDAFLGQALLKSLFEQLPSSAPVYVTPALTYGKSNEHLGFPGTLSLDASLLRRTVLAAARQCQSLGFQRLALFNTHGGNTSVLRSLLFELKDDLGLEAELLRGGFAPVLEPQEAAWGMHADLWETSLMLACAPSLVRMDLACAEYPAQLSDPGWLRPEKAPVTFGWLTRDLSHSGVLGDPRGATAKQGQVWLREAGKALAKRILQLSSA